MITVNKNVQASVEIDSVFNPIRTDYADFNVNVRDSFDWKGILQTLLNRNPEMNLPVALYIFRSKLNEEVDTSALQQLDEAALLSVDSANGFLHYSPFEGLSYCIWQSQEDAANAINTPEHAQAVRYAGQAYSEMNLLRLIVHIEDDSVVFTGI